MSQTPDIDGFLDALHNFQQEFGREVTFNFLGAVTFPPGTAIDPETQQPYDPTIDGASGVTASAVNALIVTQPLKQGMSAGDSMAEAIGRIEIGQIALVIDAVDWDDALAHADSVDVLNESYEIIRDDEDAIAGRPPHRYVLVIQQR